MRGRMKKKAPKGSAQGTAALFDFAARREFITGASKRKEQRRKEAETRALEKQKEERRLLRAQRREKIREHINYIQRSQRLAEAAAKAASSLQSKSQKFVGRDPRGGHGSISSQPKKRKGIADDAGEEGWKKSKPQPALTSEVVKALEDFAIDGGDVERQKAVRLLPPPANDASSSPWQVASCVSLSLGGFIEPPAAAAATPAARARQALQTHSEDSVCSEENQFKRLPTSVTPQVATTAKRLHHGAQRGARAGRQRHQEKRHKSRRPRKKCK